MITTEPRSLKAADFFYVTSIIADLSSQMMTFSWTPVGQPTGVRCRKSGIGYQGNPNPTPNFLWPKWEWNFGKFLITSKASDARRRGATTEAYLTYAVGGASEGNAAVDALMVVQGGICGLDIKGGRQ